MGKHGILYRGPITLLDQLVVVVLLHIFHCLCEPWKL